MEHVTIRICSRSGRVPEYETEGSAGMDLRADLTEDITLAPGSRALIPTGIFVELPQGIEAQVRARSGLAVKYGIGLVNGVGTIDSDYRGEIKVSLINWGEKPFTVCGGDRIAQLVIARFLRADWQPCEQLSATSRGEGGFGHTGV